MESHNNKFFSTSGQTIGDQFPSSEEDRQKRLDLVPYSKIHSSESKPVCSHKTIVFVIDISGSTFNSSVSVCSV